MNDQYLLAELEDKILDSVSSYMDGIKDSYSILMSGGFDSGLLAAITNPSVAYRIKFAGGVKYDETRYANAVAKHLSIPLVSLEFGRKEFDENFEEAVKIMGEPVSHFSLVPLFYLFKTLKEEGQFHVLSGEGPDEYLGGYARQIIFDELNKLYEIPELRGYHKIIDEQIRVHNRYGLIYKYGTMMGYEKEDMDKYIDAWALDIYSLQGAIGKMDMECGVIEKMELKFAKHFGITLHYPYINDEFAEYCYKLPDRLKIRDGVTKWGFRQICKKYLPEFIMDRSKLGGPVFAVNKVMGWMENGEFDKTIYIKKQKEILNEKD